ncbi:MULTISPECIES: PEP/pyruvate-binding domain-containing protein [unclassified Streptomyces]|uniref:PEP/pyruvate-binding domain-containing protein n=1 Tax=unclassified Streptomyces TaxID=2593676 RepID=UPI0021BD7AE4|nr:PEP/pyruvate-binding domain-containing protein [Streptomyces sp. BK340]
MTDLPGGKGAGLAEMTGFGLPAPPGFTVTTRSPGVARAGLALTSPGGRGGQGV